MFHLIFGIVWILVILVIFFPAIIVGFTGTGTISSIVFIGIFACIGILIFSIGLRKVLINLKTSKNGEICYGKVLNVSPTGCVLNDSEEYQAEFLIYIESKHTCERITEIIGFNYNKYPVNSLVKVKYYNGDINIISKVYDIKECSYSSQYYLSQDVSLSNYEIDTNPEVDSN